MAAHACSRLYAQQPRSFCGLRFQKHIMSTKRLRPLILARHAVEKGLLVLCHSNKSPSGDSESSPAEGTVRQAPSSTAQDTTKATSSSSSTTSSSSTANSTSSSSGFEQMLEKAAKKWQCLTTEQQIYTAVVGLVLLVAVPKVLTLLVLGLERLLIGGLLAAEEAILGLLLRGGAIVSALLAVGLVVAGLYLFAKEKMTR